jgi:predicted Zn-dependent protease
MRLENRLPAEGINASHEHPLKEFAWLVGGLAFVLVALVTGLAYAAQWIAPRIPFEYELRLARGIDLARPPSDAKARAVQDTLQSLGDRLAARMGLPPGMRVRVGYSDTDTVNAVATLGGQTVFFRGLLAKLESEDAVAMVLAHEIAHLKHRHPAASLGRGVAIGLVLSLVSAELGRSLGGGVLTQAGAVTLLRFNRSQEREADEEALRAIAQEYGHVGGALELFRVFSQLASSSRAGELAEWTVPEFMRTHPLASARADAVQEWARKNGKALDGPRRPLPPALAELHRKEAAASGSEAR